MWLIDRLICGVGPRRIPLPPPVREALVRWYIGAGSYHDEVAAIMLVQKARAGNKWIACDCLPADQAPPVLTPAFLSEAETYYLRRLTGSKRPEHRIDCPFFRDQATNRTTQVRSPAALADPPAGFFQVLRPAPENLAQKPEEDLTDDRTRNASIPRLARLLRRLLGVSGANICPSIDHSCPEPDIRNAFKALHKAAHYIDIAPGIELARAFWTHAAPLHSKKVYAALRQLSKNWPHGHAPQGFLVLFSKSFGSATIDLVGCEPVVIANRIQSPSIQTNVIKGPYLIIVVIGQYPESRDYAPLGAYAQPVYSGRRFIPVDSEFERKVLKEILLSQRALHSNGIDLAITKPVFDILTPIGPCRPDFLVEAYVHRTGEIRKIAVEAMGFDTQAYHLAKATTRLRMEMVAPVLTLSNAHVVDGSITDKIVRALAL